MTASHEKQRAGTVSFLSSGVIGVKADKAGEAELIGMARQWATDDRFRVLIVRHVDDENWGIHFVHLSDSPNQGDIDRCVTALREKWGDDCIQRLDIASQVVPVGEAAGPIVALRGLPEGS